MTEPEPTAEDVLARALDTPTYGIRDDLGIEENEREWLHGLAQLILAALTPADKRVLVAELLDEETLAAAFRAVGFAPEFARAQPRDILRALRGDTDDD